MALNEHVTGATRDGDDVILRTQPTVGEGPRKRVIRDATVEPMDGNEFPYRRVSHTELVEDW